MDGHLFVVGAWEKPEHEHSWVVPRDEVSAAVAKGMKTYKVLELVCDLGVPAGRRERSTASGLRITMFGGRAVQGRGGWNMGRKPKGGDKTVNVAVRVPQDLVAAFEHVARDEERTVSAEIRRLMRLRVAEKGAAA